MSENRDEHNHGGMLAFLFSMGFVFIFFIYIVAIHPGVNLNENIRDPEVAGAGTLAAADVDVSKVTEPWVENPDMITHGKKLYSANCAMCHGAEGKGDGAAGMSLNPKPRNFVEGKWTKGGGYIGVFNVVTNGIPGSSMAAYGHMKTVDRWALVQFVNSISENKVKEDPAKVAEFGKTAK